MTQTQTREIELSGLHDVLTLNDFIARRPDRVRLIFEEEPNNGLWQISILNLEGKGLWQLGAYIDGYENRRTLYSKTLRLSWGDYIDEDNASYDIKSHIIRFEGDYIVINLPDEWRPDVVIRANTLCGWGHPLLEPVIFFFMDGKYHVLNCLSGIHALGSFEEVERWVREHVCPEPHERPTIHWIDWYIIKGGGEFIAGYAEPTPDEVIEALRQYLK
jgi:hypothetical protein